MPSDSQIDANRPDPITGDDRHSRRWWALAVLTLGLFIASLDNTILTVALPTLAVELGATTAQLQWTVDSYQVTYAGLLLVAGAIVDRWGMARSFLVGVTLFGGFSLAAGLSGNTTTLIIARALMGVGAALLTPSTLALVSSIFSNDKERSTAFAIWAGANAAGGAVGPLLSGVLLEHFSWGSIFLINVPIALVTLALGFWALPFTTPRKVKDGLDSFGGLLSTAALALVCWSVISAPEMGITSVPIVVAFGIGVGLAVIFVNWEARHGAPILDLELFKSRRFSVAVAVAGLVTAGGAGALFILTQFLQFNLGYSPLEAGVRILPIAVAMAVGVVAAPILIHKIKIKRTVVVGLLFVAVGLAWLACTTINDGYAWLLVGGSFFGIGAGLLNPAATQAVMDALPEEAAGVGSATSTTMMQVGSALGVAVSGALLSARYRGVITSDPIFESLSPDLQATVRESIAGAIKIAKELPQAAGERMLHLAKVGFLDGMHFGLGAGALAVALAAVAVMIFYPKDSHE